MNNTKIQQYANTKILKIQKIYNTKNTKKHTENANTKTK